MKITNRHIEVFDSYINGEFNDAMSKAFEAKLAMNEELSEAFDKHLLIVKSLKNGGRKVLKEELIAASVVAGSATILKYKTRARRIFDWMLGSTIVAAVVAGSLYYYYQQDSVEQPMEQPTLPITPEEVKPVEVAKPEVIKKTVKTETITIVDTIYEIEYDTIWVEPNSKDAVKAGTTIITETIFQESVDTVQVKLQVE